MELTVYYHGKKGIAFIRSTVGRGFYFNRIVKARVQQKIECYEVEWQNVDLGEACPTSFVTIETREVIKLIINITNNRLIVIFYNRK